MRFIILLTENFVVWPNVSCFVDWPKRRNVTLRIIEWSRRHGRPCHYNDKRSRGPPNPADLIWSLAVLDPRVGHTMDVLRVVHGSISCDPTQPGFVSSRNAPERRSCSFFWLPERRSGPFRHIAAKFRFHLNESDKFALFGSKMPSASGGLRPPDPRALPLDPAGGTAPRPPYRLALPRSPYS